MLDKIRELFDHVVWADRRILGAMRSDGEPPDEVIREMAHVAGSEEVWLARLQGRSPLTEVWPSVSASELEQLLDRTHAGYATYLGRLTESGLSRAVSYTNSAGNHFTTSVHDILLHVALHAQYHRGKVNLLLRQSGRPPVPTDYVAYVRGAPAATRTDVRS